MAQPALFGEVLEVADQLTSDEQETLIDILQRRLVERCRKLLVAEVQEARREYAEGRIQRLCKTELLEG